MAHAEGKYLDDTEWRVITWGGIPFHAEAQQLEAMVGIMHTTFPDIEYKIVEDEDVSNN